MKRIVFLLLISFSYVFPQAGGTGLSFLKIGFGARNMAMGNLGVVLSNDVGSGFYNPALLAENYNSQLMLTHNEWMTDVRSELIGASFNLFGLKFVAGFNTTSISDIEVRTKPGDAVSTFNANYFYGSLSSGFNIYQKLSAGITFKFIHENLLTDQSRGIAFDFGIFYRDLIENLNIGAAVKNIGSMNELRAESTELPVDLSIGASYQYYFNEINSDLIFAAGYQTFTQTSENHINFGAEFLYDAFFALRAGYSTGFETKGLTAGLGVIWNSISFDYAFIPFDYNLGNSHIISVGYEF